MNDKDIVIKIVQEREEEEFDVTKAISTLIQANIALILMQISYMFFSLLQQPYESPVYPPPTMAAEPIDVNIEVE